MNVTTHAVDMESKIRIPVEKMAYVRRTLSNCLPTISVYEKCSFALIRKNAFPQLRNCQIDSFTDEATKISFTFRSNSRESFRHSNEIRSFALTQKRYLSMQLYILLQSRAPSSARSAVLSPTPVKSGERKSANGFSLPVNLLLSTYSFFL